MTIQRWHDGPPVKSNLLDHVVARRHLDTKEWLAPRWPDGLHDPFLLPDMAAAASRLWRAVAEGETVGIVGDYDMDGTPAAVLLANWFDHLGLKPIVILPSRAEGYGLTPAFVQRLVARNATLVVTVDCGTRSHEAAHVAQSAGLEVIITDHHAVGDSLPAALAVVNPMRTDSHYPFAGLSGTGLAVKLVQAMVMSAPASAKVSLNWLAWSLDLAAMATLADMVPLRGENRLLAVLGLQVFRRGRRRGLHRFAQACGIAPSQATFDDLVYKIIPKFNAAGRIDSMDDVWRLLSGEENEAVIDRLVASIKGWHAQASAAADAIVTAAARDITNEHDGWLIAAHVAWPVGVTGLAAGRLAERYGRPVIVLGGAPDGTLRGSGRSPTGNMLSALESCQPPVVALGGHAAAIGLTVTTANYPALRDCVQAITAPPPPPPTQTEGRLLGVANIASLERLNELAPWGVGHPEPLWSIMGAAIDRLTWLSAGRHAKISLVDWPNFDVLLFDAAAYRDRLDGLVDLMGPLRVNVWRERRTPQLIVQGIMRHNR